MRADARDSLIRQKAMDRRRADWWGEKAMRVELMVFSGRPNPSFQLTEDQAEEFARRVAALPRAAVRPTPPGLGYQGFRVTSDRAGEWPARWTVLNGVCSAEDGGDSREDTGGVEGWLLELARRHSHGDLLDALGV
jgi:hypothetical protein